MKAVLLAGGTGNALFPLANHYPILAAPIANKPLIAHLLHSLHRTGVTELAIVAADHLAYYRGLVQAQQARGFGIRVHLLEQRLPRGTAGSLRDLAPFAEGERLLVLSPSTYIERFDISRVVAFHEDRRAGLTVVAQNGYPGGRSLQNIKIDDDGLIQEYILLHHSRERRRRFEARDANERRTTRHSTGIYVISPETLDHVPATGYMDLKEQLIPALKAQGIPVYAHVLEHPLHRIQSVRDYVALNRDILEGRVEAQEFVFHGRQQIARDVWVADDVTIAPSATLRGPLVIGRHCTIGENAVILGPASIGTGCEIRRGAVVRESILSRHVRVRSGASIDNSVIAPLCTVRPRETLRHTVLLNARDLKGNSNLVPRRTRSGYRVQIRHAVRSSPSHSRHSVYLLAKRAFDLTLSASALVAAAPLFAVIALAIKRDSPGPIFFTQRRCGKDGREFPMFKFRTMVVDAPALHDSLVPDKDVDGPMFKMDNDPRVTRLGRFLRKTSLDELPQLVNVVLGHMSLVGPRPLVMKEMSFAPGWRDLRLSVQPGITGLWQVNGRHSVAFHDWIRHDIHYVKHQSLAMDVKILLHTFRVLKNATNV
jgi:lipopolysaccharide/colanic/teichoic acid biosynthesis glycosyltransferase/ADP-glucose pyrophosphorylase